MTCGEDTTVEVFFELAHNYYNSSWSISRWTYRISFRFLRRGAAGARRDVVLVDIESSEDGGQLNSVSFCVGLLRADERADQYASDTYSMHVRRDVVECSKSMSAHCVALPHIASYA